MTGLYANLPRMSDAKFAAMVVDLIAAGQDNFEGAIPRVVNETLGHQVAVLFAQRYGTGVGTAEAMEMVEIEQRLDPKQRMRLVRNAMAYTQGAVS